MITFNNIVERFKIFAENHFFIETFSFGSPDDVDLTKFTSFPLMHLVYTGATYDPGTKTYNLEIYILDVPADKTAKVDRQKEVVSDAEQCAEDIIADIKNGGNIFLFAQDYEVVNATTTPLEEETKNVLSGVLLDLSVSIPYEWDACNAPIDGVEPGGTEVTYARRGVLRMLTLDGATDVPSVRTIKVTNGTLTDDGDGVVTLDTGGVDTLAGLTDVDVTGVTDGQVLKYDDGEWIPANDQSATSLGNLDDVSLATPSNREALIYDGDNWVNDNVTKSDVGLGNVDNTSDADKPVSTATQTALDLKANTADVPTELNDLSDVTISGTPTGNQALIYNAATSAFLPLDNFTNRFEDDVERGSGNITPFVERAYAVKSDGDGIFIDNQSDTPSAGKKIVRKIYHKAGLITDTDVIGDYTLIHTFDDDTAYSATTSTFEGFRDGDTYGTPPFTLIQTWEEQTAAPAFTGLLNETYGSGAAAAYGTRRLNGNYTGACMTIRRASDGTTTTIGFDGEDIDEAAIETFCTGTTCTVQVWHDQSQSGGTGSGNDATQTDSTKQPTIYTGGALVKEGGRLALDFDGTDDTLVGTSVPFSGTSHRSSFTIVNADRATSADIIYGIGEGGVINSGKLWQLTSETAIRVVGSATFSNSAQTLQSLGTTIFNGTTVSDVDFYLNGTQTAQATSSGTTINTASTSWGIGQTPNYTNNYDGKIQEIILYASDKSSVRTDIEGNISGYYQSAKLLNEAYGSGAAAAYSVRQLNRDYTGAALQVERSSDNTTQDIGFDSNGDLDESALTTFCTGTTCRVRTWYDQATAGGTGSGNDAVQTTHANQPTIYTGGAIVKENGRVALTFAASRLQASVTGTLTAQTVAAVATTSSAASWQRILSQSTSTQEDSLNYIPILRNSNTNLITGRDGGNKGGLMPIIYDEQFLFTALNTGSALTNFLNGTSNTTTSYSFSESVDLLSLGNGTTTSDDRPLNGVLQEALVYHSAKSTTDLNSIEENIGDYFTQNTPLLDTYTGAAAAYSLRKLRSAYSGSAIRVRRASDNTEQDIGFNVFGELDTVSLASFCSGTNGFVKTWYDQSGNANDATQTTAANQPKIYDGTTGVVTEGTKPAINIGDNDFFDLGSLSAASGDSVSYYWVGDWLGEVSSNNRFVLHASETANLYIAPIGHKTSTLSGTAGLSSVTGYKDGVSVAVATRKNVHDAFRNVYHLGELYGTTTTAFSDTQLGRYPAGNNHYLNGNLQEFILYTSDQSSNRTNIEDNINTFYSIY